MRCPLVVVSALFVMLACDGKNPSEPSAIPLSPSQRVTMAKAAFSAAVAATTTAPASHNPRSQAGYAVTCFEGATDSPGGGFLGVCQRFSPTNDGAEINTTVQGANGSYAGITQGPNYLKGRLIGNVVNLNFSYAGGPHQGGVPRLSIPIDENNNGGWDHFAFIDAPGCNDGDEFVGRVNGRTDPTCNVNYNGVDYPNWNAFKTAHPTYKVASNAVTFIIVDQPAHYLLWKIQLN